MSTALLSSFFNAALTALSAYFLSGYLLSRLGSVYSFVLSCTIAALVGIIVFFFSSSRVSAKNGKIFAERNLNERMIRLYLCADDELEGILKAFIDKLHICARVCGRHMRVGSSLTVVFPLFVAPMSADDLLKVLRDCPFAGSYAVVSDAFSSDARSVAGKTGVKLISARSFCAVLNENGLLPEAPEKPKKKNVLSRLSVFLYKVNGRRFLLLGAFLFLMSSFTFYPVYYVVFGTIFVVYGLIALFFGKKDECAEGEEFEKLIMSDE